MFYSNTQSRRMRGLNTSWWSRRNLLALLMSIIGLSGFAQDANSKAVQIPGSEFSYNKWAGSGFTIEENGKFSHCYIGSTYMSGTSLAISVLANGAVNVAFVRPDWNFLPNESIDGEIIIDNKYSAKVRGTAVSPNVILLSFLITDPIFDS